MTDCAGFTVDVVIPVYNSPELTQRCIASVITHLGAAIGNLYVQDDASDAVTHEMLDTLPYSQLQVHHAPQNQGYGKSVNEAVSRSKAALVLVLNSDTEIADNFLPLLCVALTADPELAVISPVHDHFFRYKPGRYRRYSEGYIATCRFQGYGFLIRRDLFLSLGGFDSAFGRGYFEDTDLGRRLILQGWRLGVHPDAHIRHHGGASFGRGKSYRQLTQHNRSLYLSRYPEAQRNVLLVSSQLVLEDLPVSLVQAIDTVMQRGGGVHWLTPNASVQLSCLQMRNSRLRFSMIFRLLLRGWIRKDKRITTVWVVPGISISLSSILFVLAHLRRLEWQVWKPE